MLKNLDQKLTDLEGKDVVENGKVMTIKDVAIISLLTSQPTDAKGKVDQFKLAQKVMVGGEQEFTVEELKLISDSAAKIMSVLAYGSLDQWINA